MGVANIRQDGCNTLFGEYNYQCISCSDESDTDITIISMKMIMKLKKAHP